MNRAANIRLVPLAIGSLALAVLALGAGAAVAGWAEHGEAIFLRLAQDGWVNCF